MTNWKAIWNKEDRVNKFILEMLLKADGFDSPTGRISVEDWNIYVNKISKKAGIKEPDSVFDVGCGSGAFLYPLYLKNHKVGGIDYSSVLIDLANAIMKKGTFEQDEAIHIDVNKKFDVVLSSGVFLYFKDKKYAKDVLLKMIKKATKTVAIFDVNDATKESNYHEIRMKTMTKQQYEKKYKGLDHLFLKKDFFRQIAEEQGLKVEIWDQNFDSYKNAQFRFNVVMKKI